MSQKIKVYVPLMIPYIAASIAAHPFLANVSLKCHLDLPGLNNALLIYARCPLSPCHLNECKELLSSQSY